MAWESDGPIFLPQLPQTPRAREQGEYIANKQWRTMLDKQQAINKYFCFLVAINTTGTQNRLEGREVEPIT